jgi:hypothetical protein
MKLFLDNHESLDGVRIEIDLSKREGALARSCDPYAKMPRNGRFGRRDKTPNQSRDHQGKDGFSR